MLKRNIIITFAIAFLALLSGCSTEKNSAMSRRYHATLTEFNIAFNGKKAFDEGIENIEKNNKDDYSQIIKMDEISNHSNAESAKGNMDLAIEKCRKAIKLHSIKKKPQKNYKKIREPEYQAFYNQKEFNPALKKSWLMLGQAEFYKGDFLSSIGTFNYIAKLYHTTPDVVVSAHIWSAKAYLELDWIYEAEDILSKINQEKISDKNSGLYAATWAYLNIKKENYKDAIPYLKIAIDKEKKRKKKVRYQFVMAQLQERVGNKKEAANFYSKVLKSSVPYQMDFNARINRSQLTDAKATTTERELNRMAKNANNKDYLDQIYNALGNVFLNVKDTVKAKKYYNLAIEKSTKNGVEKGQPLLTMGNLYWNTRQYVLAFPYYDEAAKIFTKEYKEYKIITKRAEILGELKKEDDVVQLQDSLQNLAKLPEKERIEAINRVIEKLKKEEKDAAEKELASQYDDGDDSFSMPMRSIGSNSGDWYFYNPTTVSNGKNDFKKRWGNRKLTDDWRRNNKSIAFAASNIENEQDTIANDSTANMFEVKDSVKNKTTKTSDKMSVDYYLAQIPFSAEDKEKSEMQVSDAMFKMGFIFKEQIEDLPMAFKTFESFEKRFSKDKRVPDALFQEFLMAAKEKNREKSDGFRNKILSSYPDSKYAKQLQDPDYIDKKIAMIWAQDSIYSNTYKEYTKSHFKKVFAAAKDMRENYPFASLLPQFELLNTLSIGKTKSGEEFEKSLTQLVSNYPDTEISAMAKDILSLLKQGKTAQKGHTHGSLLAKRAEEIEKDNGSDSASKLSKETSGEHRLLFVTNGDEKGIYKLQYNLAIFNFSRFMIKNFGFETEKIEKHNALSVTGLNSYEEAMWYQNTLATDSSLVHLIDSLGALPIAISDDNFNKIGKRFSLKEYALFEKDSIQKDMKSELLYANFVQQKNDVKPATVEIIDKATALIPNEEKTTSSSDSLAMKKSEISDKDSVKPTLSHTKTNLEQEEKEVKLYKNLFSYKPNSPHLVIFYIQSNVNFDSKKIEQSIEKFNSENYKIMNLKVGLQKSDEANIITISEFPTADVAKSYLLRILKNADVKNATAGVNKRNLFATEENLKQIEKNSAIKIYFDFMKEYYFKK